MRKDRKCRTADYVDLRGSEAESASRRIRLILGSPHAGVAIHERRPQAQPHRSFWYADDLASIMASQEHSKGLSGFMLSIHPSPEVAYRLETKRELQLIEYFVAKNRLRHRLSCCFRLLFDPSTHACYHFQQQNIVTTKRTCE